MPTPAKDAIIGDLTEVFKSARGVFLADYSGLTVEMMTPKTPAFSSPP